MGTAHIFYVYDDALRDVDPEALARDLGVALLTLTMQPDRDGAGPPRVTWHRVGSHGNALQWCGEIHSREVRVYLWSSNCLTELRHLDDGALRVLADAVARERARRARERR